MFFTNEAAFGGDGITNVHSLHQWAEENPRGKIHARHQNHFRINVWAGTVGAGVVGPHILPQRLTGNLYRNFPLNGSQRLMEIVSCVVREWYMQKDIIRQIMIRVVCCAHN